MKRFKFSSILTILLSLTLLLGRAKRTLAITLNNTYPVFPGGININQPSGQGLTQLIAWFYYGVIWISGFAAFVMIIWGGIEWFVSAGNPGQISDAQDRIKSALLGILVILLSFIILRLINPDFTTLKIS